MATKFNLIKAANRADRTEVQRQITTRSMMLEYATQSNTPVSELTESVTHVLANIASTASEGRPLKLMHLNSIASFMAGVEAIASALPETQDEARKQNTIRTLTAAGIKPDGTVSYAVTPIAQLGVRKQDLHGKYAAMVQDYAASTDRGQPNGQELSQAARLLQSKIDRAMRMSTTPQNALARTKPSMQGTAPASI